MVGTGHETFFFVGLSSTSQDYRGVYYSTGDGTANALSTNPNQGLSNITELDAKILGDTIYVYASESLDSQNGFSVYKITRTSGGFVLVHDSDKIEGLEKFR